MSGHASHPHLDRVSHLFPRHEAGRGPWRHLAALFILSWVLRRDNPEVPPTGAIVAGLVGFVLAAFTGWLGGELVDRLGVGVDEGAHLDSPSSLSELPAGAGLGSSYRSRPYAGAERRGPAPTAYAGVDRRIRTRAT